MDNIKGDCCVLYVRVTNGTLAKVTLWIIITFIYLTMNAFIQRILLVSVGIWLIFMCLDNIHKFQDPRDWKTWSVSPVRGSLGKFLHLEPRSCGNGLRLHPKLETRLLCPGLFKGNSITLLFHWIKLRKSHPDVPEPSRESFPLAVNKHKGRDERNHYFKGNKKASTKKCKHVGSEGSEGGEGGRPDGPIAFLH